MKTLGYKNILGKLKGNGRVIFDKQTFYIHGLYNQVDLIVKGKLEKRLFNQPTLIEYRSNEKPKRENNNIKEQIKRIEDLFYVDYITSFNLSRYLIKKIKASIRKNNVTHMRFYTRTINSETFLKLPEEDVGVDITKSHIVIFNDKKNDCSYLVSHQDLIEPITHFVNPKINKSVSFLYTKSLAVRNTQKNV